MKKRKNQTIDQKNNWHLNSSSQITQTKNDNKIYVNVSRREEEATSDYQILNKKGKRCLYK